MVDAPVSICPKRDFTLEGWLKLKREIKTSRLVPRLLLTGELAL